MRTRSFLKAKILKLLDTAIQGGLSETTRTCGNKKCPCHSNPDKRHGPNLYLTFRTPEGRSSGLYIPRDREKHVRKAVLAWAKLWKTLVDYVAINREDLRAVMRRCRTQCPNKGINP